MSNDHLHVLWVPPSDATGSRAVSRLVLIRSLLAATAVGLLVFLTADAVWNPTREERGLETDYQVIDAIRELQLSLFALETACDAPAASNHPERLANCRLLLSRTRDRIAAVERGLGEHRSDWSAELRGSLDATLTRLSAGISASQGHAGLTVPVQARKVQGSEPVRLLDELAQKQKARLESMKARRDERLPYLWGGLTVLILACMGALMCSDRGIRRSQRAAQELLRELNESHQRFRTLTELSSDWYWEQDESFRFTQVSAPAYQILGGKPSSALGKCRWELPTEEIEGGWEAHKADLEAHRPFRNVIVRRRDAWGKLHVFSIDGMPVFDNSGRFNGYRGVTRDITEQVLAHQALEESEQRVRLATEYAEIGIWERDGDTDLIRWSPNIGTILGRPGKVTTTPAEFVTFVHSHDRDRYLLARSKWLEQGASFEIEHRIVWPDGTSRWVQQRGALERTREGRSLRSLGVIQDITRRKDAESVLRDSEEKFRLLAENMRDVFWIYNPSLTRFEYVGASYQSIWGQARELVYADPEAYRRLIVPDDLSKVAVALERQRRGEPVEVEFRIRRPDNALRWLLVRSTPMSNCRREKLVCGITEDITGRKLQERAVLQSEIRFRVLTELSSDWYWEQDEQLRFTYLSDPAYADCHEAASQALGHTRWEIARLKEPEGGWGPHRATLEQRQPFRDFTVKLIGDDGSLRTLALSGAPIFDEDGCFRGYRGIARDITSQLQAWDTIRRSEARIRQLAEGINKGFWFSEGSPECLVYVSPAFERMWGTSAAQLYVDADVRFECIHPDDRVRVRTSFQLWSGSMGAERCDLEYRLVQENGDVRWIRDCGTRTKTHVGGVFQFSGFTEDVSERKLQEQARIEEALCQRDALVREVHHRVKNTLQGVVGLLRRHAARQRGATNPMDMAIAQLQSVAIVHGLQGSHASGAATLFEMLETMATMHEELTGRRVDLEPVNPCARQVLLTEANAVAVALILNEIISNAVKHTAGGSENASVLVRVEGSDERVQIRVRNQGSLPEAFDCARRERSGSGLRLVWTMMPRDGMQMAFKQDGEFVDVRIDMAAPVVVVVDREASARRDEPAYTGTALRS